ncbi:MAG: LysM peptidoglycan-binding domain-containing protein [Deltaproteobacteria bacterium]|nr:LysM peptidoglycan-binding domain-containing protein [Deltaproteobacteria bacterium]
MPRTESDFKAGTALPFRERALRRLRRPFLREAPPSRPGRALAVVLALAFMAPAACSPVSGEDMDRLRGETEALAAELTRLKSESELLDRALTNVYREKDRVVDRLNALSGEGPVPPEVVDIAEAPAPPSADGEEAPSAGDAARPRTYVAQRGDTLSDIARRNNTTVQAIVARNPFLARRPENMVWEKDTLTLPD